VSFAGLIPIKAMVSFASKSRHSLRGLNRPKWDTRGMLIFTETVVRISFIHYSEEVLPISFIQIFANGLTHVTKVTYMFIHDTTQQI